jgi:hypothetical protein
MLFWLQFHSRSKTVSSGVSGALPQDNSHTLANAHLSDVSGAVAASASTSSAHITSVVLCFSEYHNGTWQPVNSSDVSAPLDIDTGTSGGPFDRTSITLQPWHAVSGDDDALYVQVTPPYNQPALPAASTEDDGRLTSIGFVVHNTHSTPLRWADVSDTAIQNPMQMRRIDSWQQPTSPGQMLYNLSAEYDQGTGANPIISQYTIKGTDQSIIAGRLPQRLRVPQTDVSTQWTQPFLFADAQNVFYVTTAIQTAGFDTFNGFVLGP